MRWNPFPMVRITAFLITGILTNIFHPALFAEELITVFLIVFVLLYFLLRVVMAGSKYLSIISGTTGLLTIFIAGYLNADLRDESLRPHALINNKTTVQAFEVSLLTSPEIRPSSSRATAELIAINTRGKWKTTSGKINLYWSKSDSIAGLNYGDVLVIKGSPQRVPAPANPDEFNLRRHLAFRNIYHMHFTSAGDWRLARKSEYHGFIYQSNRIRSWAMEAIGRYVRTTRERAIVTAFVLGVTSGIDDELQQAYSSTGAMHALAVSGLHVSILYGMLLFFLQFLRHTRGGRWTIAIVSLVVLWGYAFVTGLCPSVLRSVTMFSFVAIAKPVERTTNIYNTLASSAFFLLMYDPWLIKSVGFQLSYLAVIGIVRLQQPLYSTWDCENRVVDWIWQITCVSVAAQASTFAFCMMYFHQFPLYSLLSNLVVIPGSFMILIGGVILLLVAPLTWLASWIGHLLEFAVWILNNVLFAIEDLPLSVVGSITITSFECALLVLISITILLLISQRKFVWILAVSMLACAFSVQNWRIQRSMLNQTRFSVYSVRGHSALEWREGIHARLVADSALVRDKDAFQYHIEPNWVQSGTNVVIRQACSGSLKLCSYRFHGRVFLWIGNQAYARTKPVQSDFVVVSRNAVKSMETLREHIKFDHLIFDSTNSLRYCDRMRTESAKLGIHAWFVPTDGAFIASL